MRFSSYFKKAYMIVIGSEKTIIFLLLFFFLIQFAFSFSPFVNLEYLYGTASQKILESGFSTNMTYAAYYFEQISNPLFTSALIIPLLLVFPFSEPVARLPNLLMSVLFLYVCYRFVKYFFDRKTGLLVSLILMLNPLFWIYSNMILADIMFTALISIGIISFIYSLKSNRYGFTVLSGFIFGLSFITKIITNLAYPLLGIILLIYLFDKKRFRLGQLSGKDVWFIFKNFLYRFFPHLIFIFVIVLPYFYFMFSSFGWIMHPKFVSLVFEDGILIPFVFRFLSYIIWLGIFVAPFFPVVYADFYVNFRKMSRKKGLSLLFVMILLSVFVVLFTGTGTHYTGEMDFGGLDALLPPYLLVIFLFFFLLLGLMLLVNVFLRGKRTFLGKSLFAWLIFLTLAISIARPTQRYLMIVLIPVVIYLGLGILRIDSLFKTNLLVKSVKILVGLSLLFLLFAGFFINLYHFSLGSASADIAQYINDKSLSSGIDYEPKSHSYYLFEDQELYPFDNPDLALRNYSRPYYAAPTSLINHSEYKIVYSVPVSSFGVRIKELSVAEKVSNR